MGFFIKQVWGNSPTHDGSVHFRDAAGAARLAGRAHRVLLYETGYRRNGSRCIFRVGTVEPSDVIIAHHVSDGTAFDYWLPFAVEFELPADRRSLGVPWTEIPRIIGRPLFPLNKGGLITLTQDEFDLLYAELMIRVKRAV